MADPAWLEISLTVEAELAEPVAEVLARYVQGGVVIESTHINEDNPNNDEGMLQAFGPLRVRSYLPYDSQVEFVQQQIEEALWHLGQIQPLPTPTFTIIQEENWMESWKEHYRPIPVGKRLLVLPAWFDSPQDGRIPIKIDPGMAFGTGTHPTTQLCLALLEDLIQPGAALIDVGCGSGILSIAAVKLGAAPVLGVDVDGKAIPLAKENALLNGIGDRIIFDKGSVQEILENKFPLNQAPIVVANILAHILQDLLGRGLCDLVANDGNLVLSGILTEHEAELLEALYKQGWQVEKRLQIQDWVGLISRKSTI